MINSSNPKISVVTPCHNEEKNLPKLLERLKAVFKDKYTWEWVVVDDRSSDSTFKIVKELAQNENVSVQALRLSKNWGSHMAILCGVRHAKGDCVVVLAADLQDPPEVIPEMVANWENGVKVVWAERKTRSSESKFNQLFSIIYHRLIRLLVGRGSLPQKGVDFFLIDRSVAEVLSKFKESRVSIFALLAWMGFSNSKVSYDKADREFGSSSWSLRRKIRLVIDSIVSFSYAPIRFVGFFGFLVAFLGLFYAGVVFIRAFKLGGIPEGWSSLMVVILVLGGLQMLMMGILGEYLWRGLEESRNRPNYIVEEKFESKKGDLS